MCVHADSDIEEQTCNCGWYKSIKKALLRFNVDIEKTDFREGKGYDNMELAQMLLGNELSDALKIMMDDGNKS